MLPCCLVALSRLALSCLVLCCLCLVSSGLVSSCLVLALSCLALSCPFLVLPCIGFSCFVLSCHVISCLVLYGLVSSCFVLSYLILVLSCLVMSCLVLSCSSCLALSSLAVSSFPSDLSLSLPLPLFPAKRLFRAVMSFVFSVYQTARGLVLLGLALAFSRPVVSFPCEGFGEVACAGSPSDDWVNSHLTGPSLPPAGTSIHISCVCVNFHSEWCLSIGEESWAVGYQCATLDSPRNVFQSSTTDGVLFR